MEQLGQPSKVNPAQLVSGCWTACLSDDLVGWITLVVIFRNTILSSNAL